MKAEEQERAAMETEQPSSIRWGMHSSPSSIRSAFSFVNHRVAPSSSPTNIPSTSPPGIGLTISRSELLKNIETKDFVDAIRHEVNLFYEFKTETLQYEFKQFANRHGKGRSGDFLILTLLIVTILLVPQSIIQLHFTVTGYYSNSSVFGEAISTVSTVCIATCCMTGWMIFFQERIFSSQWIQQLLPDDTDSVNEEGASDLKDPTSRASGSSSGTMSKQAPLCPFDNRSMSMHSRSMDENGKALSSSMGSVSAHLSIKHSCKPSKLSPSPNMMNPKATIPPTTTVVSPKLYLTKRNIINFLYSYFMLQLQFYFLLQFIRITFHLNCLDSNDDNTYLNNGLYGIDYIVGNILGNDSCYSSENHDVKIGFLNSHSFQLFFMSFIFFKGLPQTPIKVIWLNYFLAVITFLVSIVISSSYRSFPSGIVWMLLTFFAIRDFQVRNMIIFLSTRNVKETMESRNKALEENHANEMRSLIANVAHDLKTVNSSLQRLRSHVLTLTLWILATGFIYDRFRFHSNYYR